MWKRWTFSEWWKVDHLHYLWVNTEALGDTVFSICPPRKACSGNVISVPHKYLLFSMTITLVVISLLARKEAPQIFKRRIFWCQICVALKDLIFGIWIWTKVKGWYEYCIKNLFCLLSVQFACFLNIMQFSPLIVHTPLVLTDEKFQTYQPGSGAANSSGM